MERIRCFNAAEMKKILAIDIGNSNIVIGCFSEETLLFTFRFPTAYSEDSRTLYSKTQSVLTNRLTDSDELEGSIISSVVPKAARTMKQVLEQLTGRMPLVAGINLETGISLDRYDKNTLGIDRVIDVVAAKRLYGAPVAVFDLGTATTLSVVDRKGNFLGGMISSGVQLSINALSEHTANLPQMKVSTPNRMLGTDTPSNINSGAVIGTACMIDEVISRLPAEIGTKDVPIVITGGLSRTVIPWCRHRINFEPDLLLIGLQIVYELNIAEKPRRKAK